MRGTRVCFRELRRFYEHLFGSRAKERNERRALSFFCSCFPVAPPNILWIVSENHNLRIAAAPLTARVQALVKRLKRADPALRIQERLLTLK